MSSADALALFNQGNELLCQQRYQEALACYEQSLQMLPDQADVLMNLGVVHAELNRPEEALKWYDAALRIRPDYEAAHFNRGNALSDARRYPESLAAYDEAVRCDPKFAEAWNNRGLVLMRLGRAIDAAVSYRKALDIKPSYPEAMNNLGLALQMLGYVEDAIDLYTASIQLLPDHVNAHVNLAQARLLKGDFRRGWPEYEWRRKLPHIALPPRDIPEWDGSPLRNRTILLRAEQGLGDTIQFLRYLPKVEEAGGRVVLECPARLHLLCRESYNGVLRLIEPGADAQGCDLQVPLLSLPGIFKTEFRTIPAPKSYLKADAKRVRKWKTKLPKGKLRVGICWQGNPLFPDDAFRSFPLAVMAPLAEVEGIELISLQRGNGADQTSDFPVHRLPDNFDEEGAFVDTAAVMASVDLVVTSDTAIAHLAGALGRPVWVALGLSSEWRWFRDRDDSPWYPTARLFRQSAVGDWLDVFTRMRDALRQESSVE